NSFRPSPCITIPQIEASRWRQQAGMIERASGPSNRTVHAHEIERRHARCLIDLADERRLAAHLARAMARAWAVGDTTVERYTDEADVDLIERHTVGKAEEGRNSTVSRLQLRIRQFRVALNLLHHAETPLGKDYSGN